jgi:hypothetical protein
MENQKQVSDLTVTELKAVAYDQMAQIELAQTNLRAINEELRKRLQPNQGSATQTLPTEVV